MSLLTDWAEDLVEQLGPRHVVIGPTSRDVARKLAAKALKDIDAQPDRARALAEYIIGVRDGALEGAACVCDAYQTEVHDFDSNVDAARTLAERFRGLKLGPPYRKETPMHPDPPEHIMQFFAYDHLPEHLRAVSQPFGELAQRIVDTLPRNPERTVALRKLLEAKDAAVRAAIAKEA